MAKIKGIIIEPSRTMYVNDTFKVKVLVDDPYLIKSLLITEDGLSLITENENYIRTEWGENE